MEAGQRHVVLFEMALLKSQRVDGSFIIGLLVGKIANS